MFVDQKVEFWICFVEGFLFGITDVIINNLCNISLTSRFGSDPAPAFQFYRFFGCNVYFILASAGVFLDAKVMWIFSFFGLLFFKFGFQFFTSQTSNPKENQRFKFNRKCK